MDPAHLYADDGPSPNVVAVFDFTEVVLASLSSTAAPEVVAAPVAEAPVEEKAPKAAKPKGPKPDIVAYVHVPDCIACHACEEACPTKAISVADFSVIDPNICEACNECIPVCPTDCISMQPRSGYAQLEFAVVK